MKEILEENKNSDERELKIQKYSESNAYNVVIGVFALLTLICYITKYFKGHFVVNPDYFIIVILIGACSKSIAEYFYDKKKKGNLILGILIGIASLIKIGTIFGVI
ncbi:DUF6442 family protein [Paraclostridium tenue]|uniref:Uncharacterized protein n=1 Tax=Paraclostridium tenue TaxID=1737 RepID=A0ABP3XML2_9FIRM